MADATAAHDVDVAGSGVESPVPTFGNAYGTAEDTSATRQAQQQLTNDTPVDCNPNAIICRVQASAFVEQQGTLTLMGKNFEHSASRRNGLFDHFGALLMANTTKGT